MDIELVDSVVNSVLQPLRKSGYTDLPGNQDEKLKSLETQLRSYIILSRELEPNDDILAFIEDGVHQTNRFRLETYDNVQGKKVGYIFHCEDGQSAITLKKLDVIIDGNVASIPIFSTITSPDLAIELHNFKFPISHIRNTSRNILPPNSRNGQGI